MNEEHQREGSRGTGHPDERGGDTNRASRSGGDSPTGGSAKEQSISGARGGPQAGRQSGSGSQPPQTSGRRDPAHEPERQYKGSFSKDEDPDRQGEDEDSHSPEQLKQRSSMQGFRASGAGSGAPRSSGSDNQATRQSGEP